MYRDSNSDLVFLRLVIFIDIVISSCCIMGRNQFDGIWEEVAKHETCACKGSVVRGLTLILYWIKEDQNMFEFETIFITKFILTLL